MTEPLTFIRGDDFLLEVEVAAPDGSADLTGETWRSQIRTIDGALVADLGVEITSPLTGKGRLTAPASATRYWPAGVHHCDIEFTRAGRVASSRRFAIEVLEDVTL